MKTSLTPKNIAICRLSAIGDAVMMVPLIRTIQSHYPGANITWIIGRAAYQLMSGLTGVTFIVIDKPKNLRTYWRCYQQLKQYRFDLLIAAQASFSSNILYPLIKAKKKIGFDKKRAKDLHGLFINDRIESKSQHILDGLLQFATKLGIEKPSLTWGLPIDEQDWSFAKTTLGSKKPWLVINPAASKSERNWSVDRYCQVIEKILQQRDIHIVLTGATGDNEVCDRINAGLEKKCLNLAGKTSLKQLAAIIGSATALLAPDTGPVHIATALNIPVIGLYAVAPPELSGPYLSQQLVINKYPEAVKKFLGKRVTEIPFATRVHNQDAMMLISVEEVVEKLLTIL